MTKFRDVNPEQLARIDKIIHKLEGAILDGWLNWTEAGNYSLDGAPIEETLANWEKWKSDQLRKSNPHP